MITTNINKNIKIKPAIEKSTSGFFIKDPFLENSS